MQKLFDYIDTMPALELVAAILFLAFLVFAVLFIVMIRRTKVDPAWSTMHDGQGRLIGVVKRQGHDEYALPSQPKTLDGKLVRNRRQ
jgi:hypothetical protein